MGRRQWFWRIDLHFEGVGYSNNSVLRFFGGGGYTLSIKV